MHDFRAIAERHPSANLKEVFTILADAQLPMVKGKRGVADSERTEQFSLTSGQVEKIKTKLWEETRGGMVADGEIDTPATLTEKLTINWEKLSKQLRGKEGAAADSFFNEVSGIGTGIDPGTYNAASIPFVVSPQEATAYYSNGGIAATVIDKKSAGIFTNGYQFVGGLEEDDLRELKDYADTLNFADAVTEWWRDGWIYGGALLLPWLKGDNALTHELTIEQLASRKMLEKDCIQYFWEADRWNSVLIPNYNISARDYLMPEWFSIPLAGLSVRTQRMAVAKPKKLPYWGTIRQMGWGISDFPSFMPSLLSYEVAIRAIPIISQQLSVVYLHQPIDILLAQSGMNAVTKLMEKNQAALDQWSQLRPQLLNLAGEVKALERHFTDFDKLITLLKQDVGAKAGISHTVLFNEQVASLDEKAFDTTLKQAETIKLSANQATVQLQNIIPFLVWSKWGYNSEQGRKAREVRISFEAPVVLTNEQNLESLKTASDSIVGLTQVGMQLGDAVEMVRKFIPKFEPSEEMADRIAAFDDAEQDFEEEQRQQTLELGEQKTDSTEDDNEGTGNPPVPAAATVSDSAPWMPKWFKRLFNIGPRV